MLQTLNLVAHLQEALQAERARLQELLAEEEEAVLAAKAQHPAGKATAPGTGKDGEEELMQADAEDELDAFMGQVAVQLEHDKVRSCHVMFCYTLTWIRRDAID